MYVGMFMSTVCFVNNMVKQFTKAFFLMHKKTRRLPLKCLVEQRNTPYFEKDKNKREG